MFVCFLRAGTGGNFSYFDLRVFVAWSVLWKVSHVSGGCDRAVRGSGATPDNSEGRSCSQEAGGAALLVVVRGIHAARRGFVLSRAESQSEPAAVIHLADDGLVNDEQPPTWT